MSAYRIMCYITNRHCILHWRVCRCVCVCVCVHEHVGTCVCVCVYVYARLPVFAWVARPPARACACVFFVPVRVRACTSARARSRIGAVVPLSRPRHVTAAAPYPPHPASYPGAHPTSSCHPAYPARLSVCH